MCIMYIWMQSSCVITNMITHCCVEAKSTDLKQKKRMNNNSKATKPTKSAKNKKKAHEKNKNKKTPQSVDCHYNGGILYTVVSILYIVVSTTLTGQYIVYCMDLYDFFFLSTSVG